MSTKVDHIFGSHIRRSQLSPAVFRASRNILKPIKYCIYLKISKKGPPVPFTLHQPYFLISHCRMRLLHVHIIF
eukprot:UN20814